jgi:hypothetical protein
MTILFAAAVRPRRERNGTSERWQTRFRKRPRAIWIRSNGAAWESNPPSAGLRRLTGFEDQSSISVEVRDVQPDRFGSGVVRDRVRDCQPGVGSVEAA